MSTLYGIDLSDQNSETFNGATFSPEIAFCGVKVSEGETYKDPKFIANISGIRASDVIPIFYLFWVPNDDPQAQYGEFMSRGIDWSKAGLWAVDVENSNSDGWVEAHQAKAQANLRALITLLQQGTGRQKGIIYTYHGYWVPTFGNPTTFADCLLWVAAYQSQSPLLFGGWTEYTFWQFSERGNTQEPNPSIPADVDWDQTNLTIEQLQQLSLPQTT